MPAIDARFLEELRDALAEHDVDYLFIGKAAAVIQGFVDTTQDADLFVEKTPANAERLIKALRQAGAEIRDEEAQALRDGKDFVQLGGDISIDVVHAPDGIESFDDALNRGRDVDGYRVCSIDDVISSKRSANRERDREALPRLEDFRLHLRREGRTPGKPLPSRPNPVTERYARTPERRRDDPPQRSGSAPRNIGTPPPRHTRRGR